MTFYIILPTLRFVCQAETPAGAVACLWRSCFERPDLFTGEEMRTVYRVQGDDGETIVAAAEAYWKFDSRFRHVIRAWLTANNNPHFADEIIDAAPVGV